MWRIICTIGVLAIGWGLCVPSHAIGHLLFPFQRIQGSSQVPPPPPLQGAIHHIAVSSSDQTSTIQAAINGAGSGDTIFFDAGQHVVCGLITEKAGQLYIGPSGTFPLLGQNSRATIDGCSNAGQFAAANNTMLYGISFTNMNWFKFVSTSGAFFRNNTLDDHFTGGTSIEALCNGGDTNTTIDWNTFSNISGIDNGECAATGAGSTNFHMQHNAFHYCENDCWGPGNDNTIGEDVSFNLFDRPGQNCNGCGTASAIEVAGQNRQGSKYHDNWVSGEPPGGPFAFSLIGDGIEAYNNYVCGAGAAIEWDPHFPQTGGIESIHDNYLDARNGSCSSGQGTTIFGPYGSSPGSIEFGNRLLNQTGNGVEQSGFGDCIMPCENVTYTKGPTDNPGAPAQPAAGAAP